MIFGVKNHTWDVQGFSDEEVYEKLDTITNSIYDSCTPKIIPDAKIQVIDGKHIIVVTIHAGSSKPYYLSNQGLENGTYFRVSGVTRKAEADTIRELHYEGINKSFDQLRTEDVLSEERISNLCNRMYEHALSFAFTDQERSQIRKVTKTQLLTWKIMIREGEHYYASNAFHLLEGNTDDFPDAFIQCAVFKGKGRNVFLIRKEIYGPLDQQVEDAANFVMQNIRMGSRIDGVYRKNFYELPMDSVREMIANAVCHRSYIRCGRIQVAIFDDRLEVTSPGRIDPELSLDDLKEGNSKARNAAIAAAFAYMHVIES